MTILLTLTSILNYHEKEKMKLQIHNRSIFSCMFLCFVVWALDTQNADYSNVDISKCNLSKKDWAKSITPKKLKPLIGT